MMSSELGGRIEEISLPDVLQILRLSRRTGCLHIRGPIDASIDFFEGRIVRAKSSYPYADIGTILMDNGAITQRQLRKAVKKQRGALRGTMLGRVLVQMGHATEEELNTAIRDQIDQVIDDLIDLSSGTFAFRIPGAAFDDITQDVEDILVEADVRKQEAQVTG